jgi:hypothetical protein
MACVIVRTTARFAGTPGLGETRANALERPRRAELGPREPRQLEIVEENLHELFAREREHEVVLGVVFAAFATFTAAAAAASGVAGDAVARDVFPVSREDVLAVAHAAVVERGLGDVLAGNAHFAALFEVGQLALAHHLAHRFLHVRLVAAQEALAVDRALAAVVQTSVDQMSH